MNLGIPVPPPPVVAPRRKTRQIVLRHPTHPVAVGGDAPVSVQSMCTTLTSDVNSTLQQIAELTASGCQIVRVAVPSQDDADALPEIARKSGIPVIADIHFQPKYVFAAIEAGCAGVRVNPGNIKQFDDKVGEIARAAKDTGTPIRIGVNAGSLDKRLMEKYGKATPEALVESALWEASLFEEHDFRDIKISVKHHDPVVMMQAYMQLSEAVRLPAAPRRDRGRADVPGDDQVRGGLRRPAQPGHRRHDPRVPVGAAGRGGQGRAADPRVAEPAAARPGDRVLPVLRARPGRRLHARRAGDGRARGPRGAAAGGGDGLRRQRARARRARPTSAWRRATARARSS